MQKLIEDNNLDDMGYDKKWGNYRIRLSKQEIQGKRAVLKELLEKAYENFK